MSTHTGKLKFKEKLAYGAGDLGSGLVFQGLSLFILIYWTNVALIEPAVAGSILLISRVFDGVTDIFFGRMVDKTNTKHGKARPWLLWLALPFAFSAMLTFWTPSEGGYIDILYAFISYNVTMTIYTAINIPYGVLTAKMTDDPTERGHLGIFRGFGGLVSIVVVSVLVPKLVEYSNYSVAFLVIGLLASACLLLTFKGTTEVVGNKPDLEQPSFIEGLKLLTQNTPWIIMLLGCTIFFTAFTARTTATAYYATYILNDVSLVGSLMGITLPGIVFGMLMSAYCFKKVGKIKTSMYSAYCYGFITVGFYFISRDGIDLNLLYGYLVLTSVTLGSGMAGLFPMIADTIEYGEWKTGVRIEGLTYSAASTGTKVGGGLGAALVGWSLSYYGFNAESVVQSDSILSSIEAMYIWIPAIGVILFGFLLSFNNTDRDHEKIKAALANA